MTDRPEPPLDISGLSPEKKRELLTQLLMAKAQNAASEHELSYGQRSMWFVHRLAPDSAAYTVAYAGRIGGRLDVGALERAAQALVDRHPMLRTTYTERDGQPVGLVHPHWPVRIATHRIGADAAELEQWIQTETDRPFDLRTGPVLRLTLLQRPDDHVLLLTVHHIAVDFWSIDIILNELRALYAAEHGATAPTPPAGRPPTGMSTTPRGRPGCWPGPTANGCGSTGARRCAVSCRRWRCPPIGRDRPCRPTTVRCTGSASTRR